MRRLKTLPKLAFPLVLCGLVGALIIGSSNAAWTDDRELLRFDTAKAYVFVIFDTSASMALGFDDTYVERGMDDPDSKLYKAKSVAYDVFKDVDFVHWGFASLNHDNLRVTSKHWLYHTAANANVTDPSWPIAYPAARDQWIFGKHFNATGTANTSGTAFDLATAADRDKANRFSKLQVVDNAPLAGSVGLEDTYLTTKIYIKSGATTYLLLVEPPTSVVNQLGSATFDVKLTLRDAGDTTTIATTTLPFTLVGGFLATQGPGNSDAPTFSSSNTEFTTTNCNGGLPCEFYAGSWTWADALSSSNCGTEHPFSGIGWEGNYDGAFEATPSDPLLFPVPPGNLPDDADSYAGDSGVAGANCTDRFTGAASTCKSNWRPTQLAGPLVDGVPPDFPFPHVLDIGDVLPFSWNDDHKDAILARLNPQHGTGTNFGAADYFEDLPDASGFLALRDESQSPLIAAGETTLGKASVDYRCWYAGFGNKCKTGNGHFAELYGDGGFEEVAAANDPEWGCRRPYSIYISDGADTCQGEDFCADLANWVSKTGTHTWAISLNKSDCDDNGKNKMKCAEGPGKGELLCVGDGTELETELRKILGLIREEIRAFASAAVPSVQATVSDKIVLTSFRPLQDEPVWDGHINSFLKPLPIDQNLRPDTSRVCSNDPAVDPRGECFLWDAGAQILTQVPADPDPAIHTDVNFLGDAATLRRVYYSRQDTAGTWTDSRQLFQFSDQSTDDNPAGNARRYDLWRGLGVLTPANAADGALTDSEETTIEDIANATIDSALNRKTAQVDLDNDPATPDTTITFVLGDIFHGNPLFVGESKNTQFFALNAETDADPSTTCTSPPPQDPGYRCFEARTRNRRKVLVTAANDGELHAWDAGIMRTSGPFSSPAPQFDDGTGKELWAYIPRPVLPVLTKMASSLDQQWSVDGSPVAADVFIDPVHTGTPDPTEREWRTVIVGGFREGARGYYALDVTQPDALATVGTLQNVPQPASGATPAWVPSCGLATPATGCGLPYPAPLWEFVDAAHLIDGTVVLDADHRPVVLNEDSLGGADLGLSWSTPNLGRIRICGGTNCDPADPANEIVNKYVAIFGGGMVKPDVLDVGDWIYIVDIETGQVLYKRHVDGPVASEVAAVDTDQDSFLDRIYVPTITGLLYRIDLTAQDPSLSGTKTYPALASTNVTGTDGVTYTTLRIPTTYWEPRLLFDANFNGSTAIARTPARAIYHRPSVLFVARLGLYAVAFGTGNRENLWSTDPDGRFYLFVDDSQPGQAPINEGVLAGVDPDDPAALNDLLFNPASGLRHGWFLRLTTKERMIANPFAISGVTIFSTFLPDVNITGSGANALCSKTGDSRIYAVFTNTADAVFEDNGISSRFEDIGNFTTPVFTEQSATKNRPGDTGGANNADQLDQHLIDVMNTLKTMFPKNCKFANYRIDVKTIAADTGIHFIAPVPICIVEKNWKEF